MKKSILLQLLLLSVIGIAHTQYSRNQLIVDGEYFIDTDPGEGRGIHLAGAYNFWQVNIDISVNVPVGSRIYVRFKSSNGTWSGPRCVKRDSISAIRGAKLQYAEFFINNDPGVGNGTALAISPNGTMIISQPKLRRGDKLSIRLRDSFNRWSEPKTVYFNFKDMVRAEYYVKRQGDTQTLSDSSAVMSPPNDTTSTFVATKYPIRYPFTYLSDTLWVRFLTTDRFYSKWTQQPLIFTDVKEGEVLPKVFSLSQNYPNPFNPATKIRFDIAKRGQIKLAVYDLLGRETRVLVSKEMNPGSYEVTFDGKSLSSGIYFYRIEAGGFVKSSKMILLK